jgi:malonate-semialdehyde dehydrogenase (acetylating) / methylmalonate-semialdehyde dehydrogenase
MTKCVRNYINGRWEESRGKEKLDVVNPADGSIIGHVPAGCAEDAVIAAEAAHAAFPAWRNMPASKRISYLFRMKKVLEDHTDEIAEICTRESGKTFGESKAEMVRAIENIEVACGIPSMMQSDFSEDIATGIDEFYIRQPLGVGACIAPFNFPIMIPFWFMPYAIACGNTYIIKPSEKVPFTMTRIFELFEEIDLPAGVLNMVHGGKNCVDIILEHPYIPAISFVGSSDVARYIYRTGVAHGKRVQAQGGAKNPVVIMPDADLDTTVRIIADSAFGCAGQRCLAASVAITVGEGGDAFTSKIVEAAKARKTGNGMDKDVEMGPVISKASRKRIEDLIKQGLEEGAKLVLDGRDIKVNDKGNFIGPTILTDLSLTNVLLSTEVFGPVLCIVNVSSLDEAIALVNLNKYGNSACIFTRDGGAARKFRHEAMAGNIGVNIGIAAPMAFFPFSGWKESFFGDLHGQSHHSVEFYTQTKVVIERWHESWARKF